MPALEKTDHIGRVAWVGRVLDREASLRSEPIDNVALTFAGITGEEHGGLTRPSCSRVVQQYKRGTEIRNVRQLSIVSAEELQAIADRLGLAALRPEWIGASLVIEGIADFSHIPPSSRLQAPSGATLTVDMQNRPCHLPVPVINEAAPGQGDAFKTNARGLRGVTAWVECEGQVSVGDRITLHVPAQRAWAPDRP